MGRPKSVIGSQSTAIIPAPPTEAAAMAYRAYVGDGCTTVKVKVAEAGQTLDDDVARIAAVRSAVVGGCSPSSNFGLMQTVPGPSMKR